MWAKETRTDDVDNVELPETTPPFWSNQAHPGRVERLLRNRSMSILESLDFKVVGMGGFEHGLRWPLLPDLHIISVTLYH